MSREEDERTIQRILVALDSSPASLAALEAAAQLAASLGTKLVGIFVEDVNLLRLAQISFTQEIGLFSATNRRLEIRQVQRQFRGQASRARQALAAMAERAGVDWSFQVARGLIAAELLAAASEADLIILGKRGWSPAWRRRLGSTAQAILAQGSQLTLLLQPEVPLGPPLVVVYNGSAESQKALAMATQLLPEGDSRLTLLILAEDQETAGRLQSQAKAWLERRGLAARYLWRPGVNIQDLAHTVRVESCRTLVLPGGLRHDPEAALPLMAQIDCSVLLVR